MLISFFRRLGASKTFVLSFMLTLLAQASPSVHQSAWATNAQSPSNSSQPTSMNANTIDSVLITVADEPLLLSELQRGIFIASQRQTRLSPLGQLIGGAITPGDAETILDQLVNQKILEIRTRELGLNLGEDELDAELKNFLQQQNISEDKFQEILRTEGETVESHREEFRKQVETQRFIGRVIRPLVSVTEDQVRGYYLQKNTDKEKAQLVRLRSLMIEIPTNLSSDELQTKRRNIEAIRRDIQSNRPFIELVKMYSEAKDALKTKGELPPRRLSDLPEKLREAIRGKKPPLVEGPIEIGTSVFFFEFLGTELGDQTEYQRLRPKIEAELLDKIFRERLEEYLRNERLKFKVSRRNFQFTR